jgi:hypothetical protein
VTALPVGEAVIVKNKFATALFGLKSVFITQVTLFYATGAEQRDQVRLLDCGMLYRRIHQICF